MKLPCSAHSTLKRTGVLLVLGMMLTTVVTAAERRNPEDYHAQLAGMMGWIYRVDRSPEDYKRLQPIVSRFFDEAGRAGFKAGELIQLVMEESYDSKYRPTYDHEALRQRGIELDKSFKRLARGKVDYRMVHFKSRLDGLEIPAFLFQPLKKGDRNEHPAIVWAHGGFGASFWDGHFPKIKKMVDRGYVVIAPEYRGSTGYGAELYEKAEDPVDEMKDIVSAVEFMDRELPHVDAGRVAIFGGSHGGMIALYQAFFHPETFKAAISMVPVTNMFMQMGYRGPAFMSMIASMKGVGGMPHDNFDYYRNASMAYHADKLTIPLLVQMAKNDQQEIWEQNELFMYTLKAKQPELAEVQVYDAPPGGHGFHTQDSPESRDAWNRIWAFLEYNLRPD